MFPLLQLQHPLFGATSSRLSWTSRSAYQILALLVQRFPSPGGVNVPNHPNATNINIFGAAVFDIVGLSLIVRVLLRIRAFVRLVANDSAFPARPLVHFAFALAVAALADALAVAFALALLVISAFVVPAESILALSLGLPWCGGAIPDQITPPAASMALSARPHCLDLCLVPLLLCKMLILRPARRVHLSNIHRAGPDIIAILLDANDLTLATITEYLLESSTLV